jgi:valyl-tRNA synthetase
VLNSDSSSEAQKTGTRRTLVRTLEATLRLAHPLMPYITEEIWQRVAPLAGIDAATIMTQSYPEPHPENVDQQAIDEMQWVKDFIIGARQIRSGMDIKPSQPLPVLLQDTSDKDRELCSTYGATISALARLESIDFVGAEAPESATALVGNMKLLVPMAGLIDKDAEMARLDKEIEKLEKDIQRTAGKLNNDSFVSKAPDAVVQKERDKLADMEAASANLKQQLEKIRAM